MRKPGQAVLQPLGLIFSTLLVGAFSVDTAFYFTMHQGMQNAADAAALAGVQEFFKSNSSLSEREWAVLDAAATLSEENMSNQLNASDVELGFVDPISGVYDSSTFKTPSMDEAFASSGGYNAVRVVVKAKPGQANSPIPAIFARYLGFEDFTSQAQSVAIYGGGVYTAIGLRPIYLCQAAWDTAASVYGDVTAPEITFYGDSIRVGSTTLNAEESCGEMGPGNWGLADFTNNGGAPGQSDVQSWFAKGYPGRVSIDETYQSQPGSQLPSYGNELEMLRANQTVIHIPLYRRTGHGGSLAQFEVSQIAAFVITGYKNTGNNHNRSITGYFKKTVCSSGCSLSTSTIYGGGTTKLKLIH